MPAIEVTNLQKTFQTKRKTAGLGGSVRALFKPDYSSVEAVRRLTFQMEAGELLGFIGPNGAGKSTTIKMLTGILHPSGGDTKVLGFVPWKERQKLAYHIGTVFGQRPQLWYHLPAIDTFLLFGKIYEMDDRETKKESHFSRKPLKCRIYWRRPSANFHSVSGCAAKLPPRSSIAQNCFCSMSRPLAWTWSPSNISVMRFGAWHRKRMSVCC